MHIYSRFILRESSFPRYLHSAVLLSGTLLIFGGNTHNDTSLSNGAKCFSADFLAYDIGRTILFSTPCHSLDGGLSSGVSSNLSNVCLLSLMFSSACDEWRLLPKPDLHRDVNRFGHSAVVSNG